MDSISAIWTNALDSQGVNTIDDATFAPDESQATFTVDVPYLGADATYLEYDPFGSNLHRFIYQCLGYTVRYSVGSLSRRPPARHPLFPWLRATKITRMVGFKETKRATCPLALINGTGLDVQYYRTYRLTVLFESLTYDAYGDLEVLKERERYVTWHPAEPSARIISRPGENFIFVVADGAPQALRFPQPIGTIIPEYDIAATWHQLPRNAVFTGRIPTQVHACIGKVNTVEFWGDQPVAEQIPPPFVPGAKHQPGPANPPTGTGYPGGTLLLVAAKIAVHQAPVIPQVMGLPAYEQPRTYDVTYYFKELLKGHNKAPYPTTPQNWYLVTSTGAADGPTIYETANFDLLFTPL